MTTSHQAAELHNVLITEALQARAPRRPDHEAEARALARLAAILAARPRDLLQTLAETMIELGIGDSAGVSLRERVDNSDQFRWVALAGACAHLRGGTMPFDKSPCGLAVTGRTALLFDRPERAFPGNRIEPLIDETLMVPFEDDGVAVGTLWALAHSPARKFDLEDLRMMTNLAGFAAAGCRVVRALDRKVDRYRSLFDAIDEGFCIIHVLYDDLGAATDYRFLETNAAFVRQTGLADAVGRTMRELNRDHEEHWFRIYGDIARSGAPRRFEAPAEALGRHYSVFAFPIGAHDPDELGVLFIDIGERKKAERKQRRSEERARLLLGELQHRVRNSLAVVRSIVRRTAETSEDIEEMAQHLQGRIDAFARIQSMVARNPDSGVDLTDLVEEEMLVHALREGERLAIGGPPLTLQPRSAETLSLAIHELATNAVKYGALGSETGRVHISWALTGDGSSLDFAWVESGLPGNAAEIRSDGFGMELLLRTLPYELGAETAFELAPDGCRFTMRVAADRLQMEASSAGL